MSLLQRFFNTPGCRHLQYVLFYQNPRATLFCIVLWFSLVVSLLVWGLIAGISYQQSDPFFYVYWNTTDASEQGFREATNAQATGMHGFCNTCTEFTIQARTSNGWPQTSGGDYFVATLAGMKTQNGGECSEDELLMGGATPDIYTRLSITDMQNGKYSVDMPLSRMPSGCYRIDVQLVFGCRKYVPNKDSLLESSLNYTFPEWSELFPCNVQPIYGSPTFLSFRTVNPPRILLNRCSDSKPIDQGLFLSASDCSTGLCDGPLSKAIPFDSKFHHAFVPRSCTLRIFGPSKIRECLAHKKITFIGDSVMRGYYWALNSLLSGNTSSIENPPTYHDSKNEIAVELIQTQEVNSKGILDILNEPIKSAFVAALKQSNIVIVNSGYHDIAQTLDGSIRPQPLFAFRHSLNKLFQLIQDTLDSAGDHRASVYWRQTSAPRLFASPEECVGQHLRHDIVEMTNAISLEVATEWGLPVIDDTVVTRSAYPSWFRDHIHSTQDLHDPSHPSKGGLQFTMLQVLLNRLC